MFSYLMPLYKISSLTLDCIPREHLMSPKQKPGAETLVSFPDKYQRKHFPQSSQASCCSSLVGSAYCPQTSGYILIVFYGRLQPTVPDTLNKVPRTSRSISTYARGVGRLIWKFRDFKTSSSDSRSSSLVCIYPRAWRKFRTVMLLII